MIEITPDPKILAQLRHEFPRPAKSAEKALAKYVSLLESLVLKSMVLGRTPLQRKIQTYYVSLSDLALKGGQIGPKKIRLHKWLESRNLSLIDVVTKGSNLTQMLSEVKLSTLVTMVDHHEVDPIKLDLMDDEQTKKYLDGSDRHNLELFRLMYPDFSINLTADQIDAVFDRLKVDQESLQAYLIWVASKSTKMAADKKEAAIRQGKTILAISKVLSGDYLMRKQPSAFGRMYYEGVSIQNINKELRRAVLGDSWEYDIRSSVVSWKMGYASRYVMTHSLDVRVRDEFKWTSLYLDDRDDYLKTTAHFVFLEDSEVPKDLRFKLMKRAFTALSFGATLKSQAWLDKAGDWKTTALTDIIKNEDERNRFINDKGVKEFMREQNLLDDFIFEQAVQACPYLLNLDILKTQSGRISKPKVLAYLYQHAETMVMEELIKKANSKGHHPIAKVHDAIFFKKRLGTELKEDCEIAMREQTGNPYWRLKPTQLERYKYESKDELREVAAHKARIAQEEKLAKIYAASKAKTVAVRPKNS